MQCAERDRLATILGRALSELKWALDQQGKLLHGGNAADADRLQCAVDVFEVRCEKAATAFRTHLVTHRCTQGRARSAGA